MYFSKRPDSNAVCYTKPLDSLKRWNDHFFWVESFACLASFPWHTDKNVSRDPFPKSTEFNADDYVVLVAHPALFRKFSEHFLCLIGMSRYYTLDEDTYPRFLHDDGTGGCLLLRERAEGEARLLDFTVGRVVPLLPVASARAESELEASVDKLFDEGGSADQGDSAAGDGQDTKTELVTGVKIITAENVIAERPKRPRKKRQVVTDASGSSHPSKKLRGGYETSGGATSGKSSSVLKELLASSMLNVEVGVAAVATLPLVTSSVSATPEHENSSHHSSTNASGAEGDSIIRSSVVPSVMTEAVVTSHSVNAPLVLETGTKVTSPVHASMFHESDSTETVKVDAAEFNVGTVHQACLNVEVRMRTEYCLSKRKRLESECEKKDDLLKAKDDEIENLKAQLLLKETEAAKAAHLRAQVSATEATEKMHAAEIDALKQRNVALKNEKDSLDGKVAELQSSVSAKDLELKDLNVVVSSLRSQKDGLVDQVAKLDADLLEMALHLEEKFYPHLLTTISGRRWLLTHGLKLAFVKCLNSQEYLSALGAAISRAIEKGMQDGLSAGIVHRKEGRSLANVAAYNPVAKADYNSSLQRFREVDFHLLSELSSYKNASVEDIMNLLQPEGPLTDASRMSDLQPNVDQLMLLVHRIRENVAAKRSALIGVWTPLVDALSAENLVGAVDIFDSVPVTNVTTTALSTTFAFASSIPPITIEDYEILGTDGPENAQTNGQGNVASFPTVEFEKEELDTTPKRDLPN
ncbi:hypothetical protein Tco_1525945 [Tanacetum coccineum]